MIKASIIIATYNMGSHIKKTIRSVLLQSVREFELIIIDDGSEDNTRQILDTIHDPRIKRINIHKNVGVSEARNMGIKASRGYYIFFTDADCIVTKTWLAEGLKFFKENDCIGIEGKIYYVSKTYQPTYADRVVQNLHGGEYMTANMAYKKSIFRKTGLFDPAFKRNSDRDIALKAKNFGEILFNPNMVVYHTVSKWKPKNYFESGAWVNYRTVLLFKRFHEKYNMLSRIYAPEKLFAIFFPPILLLKLFSDQYRTKEDYILFSLIYPRLVYERLVLWKSSIREKVLII